VVDEVGEGTTSGHPPPGGVVGVVARIVGRTDYDGLKGCWSESADAGRTAFAVKKGSNVVVRSTVRGMLLV